MSNDNEKGNTGFKRWLDQHPIRVIAGVLVGWTAILMVAFGIWLQGTMISKDAAISLLERKLDDCVKDRRFLENEVDSLKPLAKGYSTSVLCRGDADTFVDGKVSVTLERARLQGDTWEHLAQFLISDVTTGQEWIFKVGRQRNFKFQLQNEEYILYFLGFEDKIYERCTRILIRKSP